MFRADSLADLPAAFAPDRLLPYFSVLPTGWQYGFAVLLGLIIGSFLTVVVERLPVMLERAWREEVAALAADLGASPDGDHVTTAAAAPTATATPASAAAAATPAASASASARYDLCWPASSCPACGHALRVHENIPLLSFIALRGRCSACGTRIPWRYPALELLTALLAVALLLRFGPTWTALSGFVLGATLLALGFIDARTRLLPDTLTLPLLWGGLLINLYGSFATLGDAVLGAAAGYVSLWSIYWLFRLLRGKEGIGYGDFKLLAALGAWLGWMALPQIVLCASVAGAVFGLVGMARGRLAADRALAFGPFLAAAGIATLIVGTPLYRWL